VDDECQRLHRLHPREVSVEDGPGLYAEEKGTGTEPESGIEPLTYALRVRCSAG
jgi:hypothetical protein